MNKFKFGAQVDFSYLQPCMTNCPWKRCGYVTWAILNFLGTIYSSGTTEARVIIFCTQILHRWHHGLQMQLLILYQLPWTFMPGTKSGNMHKVKSW